RRQGRARARAIDARPTAWVETIRPRRSDDRAHAGDADATPRPAGGGKSVAEGSDPDAPPFHSRHRIDGADGAASTAPGPRSRGVPAARQPRSGPGEPGYDPESERDRPSNPQRERQATHAAHRVGRWRLQ